jgi:tRNA(fMet)-specific endonuclease VapC
VTVDINVAEVIDAYVEIDVYSQQHPGGARNMGKNDLWIAACAKASGATLLTTDKDFDHLNPGMISVEYVDPASTLPEA